MPFEFEYALKLIKASRLFVQDRLLPTVVPAEKNVGMKNIYVLSQKIKGFSSQNLKMVLVKMIVRERWFLYSPAPFLGISYPTSCSPVGQLDSLNLKVVEMHLIDFIDVSSKLSCHDLAWQHRF